VSVREGGAAGGSAHLQHGDLHLVVAVRGVGSRDDEEAAFLVELIQQAGGRVHGRVDLHGWGERPARGETPFRPPRHPFAAGQRPHRAQGTAAGRTHPARCHLRAQRGWEPVHCWVDWQTRREMPWRS